MIISRMKYTVMNSFGNGEENETDVLNKKYYKTWE